MAPEEALAALVASGGAAALCGDRDPVELVEPIARAAGRPFACVDGRGLHTADFDVAVRGRFRDGAWEEGALTRTLRSGGVFLLAHAEQLLDDLRQRTVRMLLTRTVALTGPSPDDDLTVTGDGAATLLLHVDDHVSAPLQVMSSVRRFPAKIRADVAGPPPVTGPPPPPTRR